ncbi:hypothetical protein QOZ80_2BG0157200 [Eleusine coracana subsp. coracana]|nr:hypothetical protein QOZ80_2BG0157200 [Eleusine coracana subsp. coracana]
MASAAGEDAIVEAEAAGNNNNSKKNRRRICDYLGESSGGEGEGEASSPPEMLLRLPRFTCATFRFARLGRKRGGRSRKEGGAKKTENASVPLDSSASGAGSSKPAETSTMSSGGSAEHGGGMGLSMLLLLARTCVELNRMAEVRAQMEALLKEIRDETSRMKKEGAHHAVTPTRTLNLQLSSTTTVSSSSFTSSEDTDTNRRHATTSSSAEEIARQECESKTDPAGEDELELEAAAEFEAEHAWQRPTIEWNTEQEDSDESSDDDFIELAGGRFGGIGSGDFDRDEIGEEDSEEESTRGAEEGGVCAAELERRLHELLHQRDRERIEELESALRRAEQRLKEKEMEARLWQDTATLALQPPPPPRDGQ